MTHPHPTAPNTPTGEVIAVDIAEQPVTLRSEHHADGPTVWVEARPNLRRAHVLAGDILAALGKRRDLTGQGRNQHEDLHLAVIWLRAHDTRDLVILDAQRLHSKILGTLTELAARAQVRLWLLHRAPTSDAFLRALARRATRTAELADVPQQPPPPSPLTVVPAAFPAVPRHDFYLFRTACTQLLPEQDAAVVLTRLDDVAQRAYRHLHLRGADIATLADLVDDTLDAGTDDHLLTTDIRGVQLAAWHHDWYLRVDLATLIHAEERPTLAAQDVDAAITAYRQPHRALTCALTRRRYPLHAITALRLRDVGRRGRRLSIAGDTLTLPPALAATVRAAALLQQHAGAGLDDPLLPYSERALAATLTDATTDLGLHVKGRRAERSRPAHHAHLRRLGVTAHRLP